MSSFNAFLKVYGSILTASSGSLPKGIMIIVIVNPFFSKSGKLLNMPIYDFALKRALSLFDKTTAEGKRSISKMLLPVFGIIENEIVKEHYLKRLSEELNTTYESIGRELDRALGKPSVEDHIKAAVKVRKKRSEILEEYLFSLLIQHPNPKEGIEKVSAILADFEFDLPVYRRILEAFIGFFKKHAVYDSISFAASLPREATDVYNSCFL